MAPVIAERVRRSVQPLEGSGVPLCRTLIPGAGRISPGLALVDARVKPRALASFIVTVVRSTVSTSRHSFSSPAEPTSEDPGTLERGAPSPASATITGADGTVLVTISRHSEQLVPDQTGSSRQTSLIVVDVVGDVDADTAPLLHTALTHAVRRNRQVCCDLSRTAFLGAAGVNTILAALHAADDTGCVLTVRGVQEISARVFRITGLDAVLAARA